jgi:histidinol-phosphate phosphatase family protein
LKHDKMNRAVFLDRDGTIARDVHYCRRPEDFVLYPNAAKVIRLLNNHGFKIIIITNQSGIAHGYFSEETLGEIHKKMRSELGREGARVDGIYYCPHHPDDNCECRKPRPSLILQATRDFNIDLKHSFVVGDLQKDIELGKAVGCRTILLSHLPLESSSNLVPDAIVSDLMALPDIIFKLQDDYGDAGMGSGE